MLSDNGSCFVGQNGRKKAKEKGTWVPTLFEEELLARDIILINPRPYRPQGPYGYRGCSITTTTTRWLSCVQTNGKLECFHRSLEDKIWYYDSLREYVDLQ